MASATCTCSARATIRCAIWLDPAKVAGARPDGGRSRRGAAGRQPAGRRRRDQPAAGRVARRASQLVGPDAGPADGSPEQFGDIVVRAEPERLGVRGCATLARVELGAQDYTVNAYLDNKNATALVIFQRPGSNALDTAGRGQGGDGGG